MFSDNSPRFITSNSAFHVLRSQHLICVGVIDVFCCQLSVEELNLVDEEMVVGTKRAMVVVALLYMWAQKLPSELPQSMRLSEL